MDTVKRYDWALPKIMPPLGSPVTTSTMRFRHDLGAATKGPDENIRASQLVRPIFFVPKAAEERKRKNPPLFTIDEDDEFVDAQPKTKKTRTLAEQFGGMNNNKWKCLKCFVQSDNSVNACSSCESIRPGYEKKQMEEKAKQGKTSSASIGSSGFTFPGPNTKTANGTCTLAAPTFSFSTVPFGGSAPAAATSGISLGATPAAATGTTGGFVFGAPATDSSAPATTANSIFSFGAASGAAGGISFGFGAASSAPAADQKDSEASSPKPAASQS